ncbi:tetratricopeptide repeat protein [Marilutibacter alkalisoli]|uniref:Tetratricopeptide repeat protein n=1 Tax=Marilutibacter alkalisoli TaxID=2591633 RepID=A0A514BT69_9GAMM|nr:tetratricopeptide repeat protein [Lysobacter alkalisoli]QDH70219.1 tetratricopeptide repeat protein [Lysobacter alkalisoli]
MAAALRHFDAAIELEPGFVPGMNNIGVARNRLGDIVAAEQAYLAVLDTAPQHPAALSNLVNLYRHHGEAGKAARYERRLARMERRDPYRNFVVGLQHERRGDHEAALDAYRRAIRLHRGEPQFHLGLARVHALMGNEREAGRQWAMARSLKSRPADRGARDAFRDPYRDLFQRRSPGAAAPMP